MASQDTNPGSAKPNSFYESFRWLEDDDALDLRLGWDHFTNTLPEDSVAPLRKPDSILDRRPSFRRHLSMNKLSFSRPTATQSRPGTKDTTNAPSCRSQPSPAPAKPNGHVRRKSRALSLISLNKQAARETPKMIDPAASYYQDPSARSTLRQYTASPQKFDEALEHGFPSLGEVVEKDEKDNGFAAYKLRTFLDDDKSSTYSNDSTVSDPDSPKTPPIIYKPLPAQETRSCTPSETSPELGYAQEPSSREMTMRMTLTRPDLRANEDQIYGWQKSAAARKAHMRGEALAPVQPEREPGMKDMEKHFDALDKENIEPSEKGGMRRFWKRVRRT